MAAARADSPGLAVAMAAFLSRRRALSCRAHRYDARCPGGHLSLAVTPDALPRRMAGSIGRRGCRSPHQTTVWVLKRIVEAIGAVEGLRSSDDPLVNGPAPQDPALRNTWLKLRSTKVRPVETELDLILGLVQRDYSPELAREDWPIRLVSCLTACERYFEQRARLGEERAGNRDLAVAQWSRLLAAGEALEALSRLKPRSRAAQRIPD